MFLKFRKNKMIQKMKNNFFILYITYIMLKVKYIKS